MQKTLMLSLMTASLTLSGCAGVLFGGAVIGTAATVAVTHDRRSPGTVVDDRNTQLLLSRRLMENKALNKSSHANFTVFNGLVVITGEAANQQVLNAIVNLARSVPNIRGVKSELAIMPNSSFFSRSSDTAITTKVKAALLSLKIPNFDTTLIKVTTERRHVYLMGIVTQAEAAAVINQVRRVKGVSGVTDIFEYVQPTQVAP